MRGTGFNRLSIGAQSFDTGDLVRLGRVHGPVETGAAVDMAREAGFDDLNLDLMFGLPGQSFVAWRRNLDLALRLRPEHLSLYSLTIEPNTRFYRLHVKGMLDLPEDEMQVRMYEDAIATCASAGYGQYEISNFAQAGHECRHNLCYWRAEEYLGYGPGAVGCVQESAGLRRRYTNLKHPERYASAVESGSPVWAEEETVDDQTLRLERIMLGIRLNEGLPIGSDVEGRAVADLVEKGWISVEGDRAKLTSEGRLFCSDVAVALA